MNIQKEYVKFEELSEIIVQHIFKDTNAVIKKTQETKDGGYDIVVEFNDGQRFQKVYFECKLRNKNLNMRDIAANVIIAFNEGAVALVAFTNSNYTPQADEHFSQFIKKTILNIKIIIGKEIDNIVKKYNIPISDSLSKLIMPKRSNRNQNNSLLQIDFTKSNIHEQIINTFTNVNKREHSSEKIDNKLMFAMTILGKGGILTVSGFLGVGKRTFVKSITEFKEGVSIWINASLHQTQERVLAEILFNIWGISASIIFDEFTDTHIDTIIDRLKVRIPNQKTLNILRRLFGDTKINGINDEYFNILICDYIVDMLQMHQDTFKYLFVFESLAYAKYEIFIILTYLIKRLALKKIPCVIIQDTEEYSAQRTIDLWSLFGNIPSYVPITINAYTENEAIDYIRTVYPKIPLFIAKNIVGHTGTRKANISMFLEHINNMGIHITDNKHIAEELQLLQPNLVPTIMSKVLQYYRSQNNTIIFDLLFLLHGKINEKLCYKLNIDNTLLDSLIRSGILSYHQGYYVCASRIVCALIDELGYDFSSRLRCLALDVIKVLEEEAGLTTVEEKAYLLRYARKPKEALAEIYPYIIFLENERQLDMLISCCDFIIETLQQLNNPLECMKWIIYQLKIMRIKKDLLTPKANTRIKELAEYLMKFAYLNPPHHYTMAYDYFTFMVDFKNGKYNTNIDKGLKMRQYFENAVNGIEKDNFDDWLGNICDRYVLCIKESEGYDAAFAAYINVRKTLPDSYRLWRGYISHMACMNLYNAPNKAFEYYEEIINSSHKVKDIQSLPFHEYVDRAMSKLLSNDILAAESFSRYAVDICEANAILDEWGRGLNILGCVLICQGKLSEAKKLFKESLEMLKISGYKLFSWRSQLNYIHVSLIDRENSQLLINELDDAYKCFKSLHSSKLTLLLAKGYEKIEQSRDYHALLAFSLYRSKLSGQFNCTIAEDFKLGYHMKRFQSDLYELLNNPFSALPDSTFYRAEMIMTVG